MIKMILVGLVFLATTVTAIAAPKKSSTGESCTSSGEKRSKGKDAATGEVLDCLFDYCTYCGTKNGTIDCSILKTELSNARDCKPAARTGAGGTVMPDIRPGVLDPGLRRPQRPIEAPPKGGTLAQ